MGRSVAALTLCMLSGCNGATTDADGANGGGGSGSSVSSSDSGSSGVPSGTSPADGEIHSPDLPIEGSEAVSVLGSTLGRYADGGIFWAFTFRNETSEPFCSIGLINATLRDSDGNQLAGASIFSDEFGQGAPAFNGVVMGSIYRGRREDGVVFLTVCVPPGGRGLAFAEIWSQIGLQREDNDQIFAAAASLGHDLSHSSPGLEDLELAPELPRLDELQLVETAEGKWVRGVAVSSATLGSWYAYIALFDANGMIVDVVRAPAEAIETLADTPVAFSSAPTLTSATRVEAFFESSSLRH